MMQIVEKDNIFEVKIPYDRFRVRNQNAVKSIAGASFNWATKSWIVPKNRVAALQLVKEKCKAEWISLGDNLPVEIGEIAPLPELIYHYELKKGGFRDYQAKGVARGLELKRYINGDEQRLGKTLQTIGTLVIAEKFKQEMTFPSLIICPSGLKINWKEEWEMWTGKKAMILDDKIKNTWHRYHELGLADVFIVNYQSLKKFFVDYMPPKGKLKSSRDIVMNEKIKLFKSIVIDESHRCKDPGTQQAKIALQIAKGKEWVILLSGTPVKNKPIDLFAQLAIMGRLAEFGGPKRFKDRYCEGGSGSSNLKELNYLLNKNCFFRRERKEVLKDLPEKQRQTILCDITTRELYNKAKNDFVRFLQEKGCSDAEIARKLRGEIMVKMGELKRISALGKLNEVKEYIQDVIDNGEKIVIFCVLHSIVDELKRHFPNALSITGRENDSQKQANKNTFQKCAKCGINFEHHDDNDHAYVLNDYPLIICNIQAAGVGLNLSAASIVGFVEYPWTAADSFQCEDRIFDTKKNNHISCTYFLGHKTIDEDNFELIKSKAGMSNAITGSTDAMDTEIIDRVMNSLGIR